MCSLSLSLSVLDLFFSLARCGARCVVGQLTNGHRQRISASGEERRRRRTAVGRAGVDAGAADRSAGVAGLFGVPWRTKKKMEYQSMVVWCAGEILIRILRQGQLWAPIKFGAALFFSGLKGGPALSKELVDLSGLERWQILTDFISSLSPAVFFEIRRCQ